MNQEEPDYEEFVYTLQSKEHVRTAYMFRSPRCFDENTIEDDPHWKAYVRCDVCGAKIKFT